MNVLPSFLLIGAMKSGTTTLYDDLRSSPEFALPDHKEPGFLTLDEDDASLTARYRRHFAGETGRLRGDGSTAYAMVPRYPSPALRARALCGEGLKIVMILRDPVERILSHLRHEQSRGRLERTDFDRVIEEDPSYLAFSDYPAQLAPWVEAFGPERVHCVSFEGFMRARRPTVCAVAEFLGADPAMIGPCTGYSNASEVFRPFRHPLAARVTHSDFYRYRVRPLLVGRIHARLKRMLTREPVRHPVALSEETVTTLRRRFDGIEDQVAALTGRRIAFVRSEGASA